MLFPVRTCSRHTLRVAGSLAYSMSRAALRSARLPCDNVSIEYVASSAFPAALTMFRKHRCSLVLSCCLTKPRASCTAMGSATCMISNRTDSDGSAMTYARSIASTLSSVRLFSNALITASPSGSMSNFNCTRSTFCRISCVISSWHASQRLNSSTSFAIMKSACSCVISIRLSTTGAEKPRSTESTEPCGTPWSSNVCLECSTLRTVSSTLLPAAPTLNSTGLPSGPITPSATGISTGFFVV
mmetsp:Transcript_14125/g.37921  ORF Transcript_14125/g.37921 Transcript_14125/m.37921 type:complete len:243 (-) Transcript_14125:1527-2255(-)